jgi:sirohydrochlorin ferrochelatase
MRADPTISTAASGLMSENLRVYPLFMSNGYYVKDAIPKQLGVQGGKDSFGHSVITESPLGLDPSFPGLLHDAAQNAVLSKGYSPKHTDLLIVAHGSAETPDSARIARQIAAALAELEGFASVDTCFLEESPYYQERLKNCRRATAVLGLFAGCGLHAGDDLQQAMTVSCEFPVFQVEQLGGYAAIIEHIATSLAAKVELPSSGFYQDEAT